MSLVFDILDILKNQVNNVTGNPRANTIGRTLKGRPIGEFMDELAKRLGKHYGLNDIREAL